ncbi:inositol 2-dehydrogenase [soil metagenome]
MTDRLSVALIGAGRIGKRHARTLAFQVPNAELAIVCDLDETRARSLATECRCDRWSLDAEATINDPSVDAVVIATSTVAHAHQIVAAARAGKHVFCEKPIALDLASTDLAINAAETAGITLQIGFQRRFDKGFAKAKAMIEAGTLGRIESIRETMRDPGPPPPEYIPTSGGLFRDMVIHDFDCVRWLIGENVAELFAYGSNLVDPIFGKYNDIDTSIVSMKFDSGALAVLDNSRRAGFGYDIRTEIFGSEGALFVGYSRDTPILHLSSKGVLSDHVHWFLERFDDAYVEELQVFVHTIAESAPSPVTGADARAALILAMAAETSVKDGIPVKIE